MEINLNSLLCSCAAFCDFFFFLINVFLDYLAKQKLFTIADGQVEIHSDCYRNNFWITQKELPRFA